MGTAPLDWFARRTYHAGDFDVEHLAAAKRAAGLSVSVVLPAKNEAGTVAEVVRTVVELKGRLVDEIVVLDGSSTDGTPEIAEAAGARVCLAADVMPELGPTLGKGDALWRSLTVTSGDLVVFLDSDIANPDPRFVRGLLGPLLNEPDVALVKGFYDRPVEVAGVLHPTGGGRVTELCARPLLNLLWPELAGLVQPLAGEYAGRRSLLERLPFFCGYGVELGLLIDTAEAAGVDAIAQVDLEVRIHRNQAIPALSRMAFGVAQVAWQRAAGRLGPPGAAVVPSELVQFTRSEEGWVQPVVTEIEMVERPPLRKQPGEPVG